MEYIASKRDPSLIKMRNKDVLAQAASDEVTSNNQRPKESELLSFKMMPKMLINPAIYKYPLDQQVREKLFRCMIQYHNQSAWKEDRLCPQSYLDCEISDDQHNVVLKMSTADITFGAIMGL